MLWVSKRGDYGRLWTYSLEPKEHKASFWIAGVHTGGKRFLSGVSWHTRKLGPQSHLPESGSGNE